MSEGRATFFKCLYSGTERHINKTKYQGCRHTFIITSYQTIKAISVSASSWPSKWCYYLPDSKARTRNTAKHRANFIIIGNTDWFLRNEQSVRSVSVFPKFTHKRRKLLHGHRWVKSATYDQFKMLASPIMVFSDVTCKEDKPSPRTKHQACLLEQQT